MFAYLYEWIRNVAFYLVLVTALLHVLPRSGYQKYIRFAENMKEVMQILPHLELQSTYSMERSFVDEYWKQLRTIFEEMYE